MCFRQAPIFWNNVSGGRTEDIGSNYAAAIRTSLAAIPMAIDARDWNQLRTILDTLSDLLFYLED